MSAASPQFELTMWRAEAASAPRPQYSLLKFIRLKTLLYSSTAVCLLTMLGSGYDMGFSSPALHYLSENSGKHTYFNRTIYRDTFNSIGSVGALIGAPLSGLLADHSGRQLAIVLCNVPLTIGWMLILISNIVTGQLFRPLLFAGRFIVGVGAGASVMTTGVYLAEISPKKLRGLISSLNQVTTAFGILLPQALGIKLNYAWLSVIALAILLIIVHLTLPLKESPRWLINHGKNLKAGRVLAWFRGPNFDVESEQREIEAQFSSKEKLTIKVSDIFYIFFTRSVLHPMLLSLALFSFQQLTGMKALIYNGQFLFEQVGVKQAATVTAITVGGIYFLASIIVAALVDFLGRKVILVSGNILMCLSLIVLSLCDLLRNEPYCHPPDDPKCKDGLQFLAIAAMIAYMIGAAAWGAIPWLIASEIIPLKIRGVGIGIGACFYWLSTMIILLSFGSYQDTVKPWGAYLSFAVINVLSGIFVVVLVPETKGKSLEETEKYFNHFQRQYISL